MYNEEGETTWQRSLDSNGNLKTGNNSSCPFLFQGQYYDEEIELTYNRFRYYSPDSGTYISQDPIGLFSGEANFYTYVSDTNGWVDPLGLTNEEFTVGIHSHLKKRENKASVDLRSHHVGQDAIMKDLVKNHNRESAPVILVHNEGHNKKHPDRGIVSRSKINPKTRKPFTSARDLLARDIRELKRVYPNIPNKKIKELIDLNKKMYPEMRSKKSYKK